MQKNNYQALKISDKNHRKIDDTVVVEAALQININNKAYTVVMRTPNNDFDLIRGLLFAEDIYKGNNLKMEVISTEENQFTTINCSISKANLGKGYLNKRTLLSVSSCGICGKQELNDIELKGETFLSKQQLKLSTIPLLFSKMKAKQTLFKVSGGSHAAAIFDTSENLVVLMEDIGRHNAVDKCIGELLERHVLKQAFCMLVSGRVSYEIISKAFIAKIPIIIAVSACSSLAIDYAKELGICLIGFAREEKATVYANPQYLKM